MKHTRAIIALILMTSLAVASCTAGQDTDFRNTLYSIQSSTQEITQQLSNASAELNKAQSLGVDTTSIIGYIKEANQKLSDSEALQTKAITAYQQGDCDTAIRYVSAAQENLVLVQNLSVQSQEKTKLAVAIATPMIKHSLNLVKDDIQKKLDAMKADALNLKNPEDRTNALQEINKISQQAMLIASSSDYATAIQDLKKLDIKTEQTAIGIERKPKLKLETSMPTKINKLLSPRPTINTAKQQTGFALSVLYPVMAILLIVILIVVYKTATHKPKKKNKKQTIYSKLIEQE